MANGPKHTKGFSESEGEAINTLAQIILLEWTIDALRKRVKKNLNKKPALRVIDGGKAD